jgi:predicted nuclease of restriction endonuclease-like (RecB) superfamily
MSARDEGLVPHDYARLLDDIKDRIRTARVKAELAVNRELVLFHWHVGHRILEVQHREGWGARVVDRLAADLGRAFPDMSGFSSRNLKYMRAFAEAWPDNVIVQQVAAQLPWFHNCVLLDKVSDPVVRKWYARATVEHGWSRNVLVHRIESDLYAGKGKALTNFDRTLPAPQSELPGQMLKDPYHLDFLGLSEDVAERELELSLLSHLERFLLELGVGFAFVGR